MIVSELETQDQVRAPRSEIWFSPEDSIKRNHRSGSSPSDFMDLFPAGAPWPQAAARIQVFQISPQFADKATDAELSAVIEGLKRRNIALAQSCGMLHRPPGGVWHEGYGAETAPRALARIKRLGGEVRYAVADEPLWFGHFYHAPGAISVSIADVAADMAATARAFREIFPDVRIGMDDPVMHYESHKQWKDAMGELLGEYREAFGEPMGFVRVENADYPIHEWLPRFIAAGRFLEREQVPFGILVTGDSDDTSDADWFRKAEERYVAYESDGRPAAAQMVFQSWMPRPTCVLPETLAGTHAHSVNAYFRSRTVLGATRDSGRVVGRLTDETGKGVAGARVVLSVLPGLDDPAVTHRIVKGIVPAGAKTAHVGLRIGIEGSRAGTARLGLGTIRYAESTDGGHAAAFEFDRSMKGWGIKGTATAEPKPGEGGTSPVLDIAAAPGQTLMLNSRMIPVTPGREFTFDFEAHVQPVTETGYLVVFFFDEAKNVILRQPEPIVSRKLRFLRDLWTDARGRFETTVDGTDELRVREIWLNYAGDEHRRPAIRMIEPQALNH